MPEQKFGVFDFDGTIVDAMPVYFGVSAHLIESEYGLSGAEFERFSTMYTGAPIDELFAKFLVSKHRPVDRVADNIRTFFELVNAREFPVIAGAPEAIARLHARGVTLFISTGSQTQRTKERLEQADLLKYFTEVYGSSEVEKGPEHIKDFARHCGVPLETFAQRSFFLGDGPGDMKLAKLCRMKAVGVAHTFEAAYLTAAGADLVLPTIGEAAGVDLI